VRLDTGGAWAIIGWPINKGDALTSALWLCMRQFLDEVESHLWRSLMPFVEMLDGACGES
jgi:hypothetical protein